MLLLMETTNQPSSAAWTSETLAEDPHARPDKPDRVRSMFASIAGAYDLNNRLHSFGLDQRWRRALVSECRVRPSDAVLDVACGTGDLTECFARARPASVTGVDFTPPMLDIARVKADRRRRRRAGEPRPTYAVGDATALEFPDASFDIVSIAFGIRNVGDPEKAFAEFRRVLRPGGRLAVLEFATPRNPLVRLGHDLWTRRIMPRTATLISGDRSGAYHYLPRSVATFLDPDALADAIVRAGFASPRQRRLTFGTCVAQVAEVASPVGPASTHAP
jgi:demethylmenaquinone methyltransferase/2-methoxy-6-polyprenyl-1,4-benzoquinol methylase